MQILKWIQMHWDPYEMLFLCVSIATLPHTAWSLSSLFEGSLNNENSFQWHLTGIMLSIAIDVGMLISARLLVDKASVLNKIVLIFAFIIAASGSLYSQLIYLLVHGDGFTIPTSVPIYWRNFLQPIIDARVILIPVLLPLLATVYAAARIFSNRHQEESEEIERIEIDVNVRGPEQRPVEQPLIVSRETSKLQSEQQPLLVPTVIPEELVDWEGLRFFDTAGQVWKGPFESREALVRRYEKLQAYRAKNGMPAYADIIAKRNMQKQKDNDNE